MKITRRDLLTIAGGSLLGTLFTPIPWKLLDDSAIWTQNWPLIPTLPRGPVTFTHTFCPLCPGGCAVRARRVNGYPVSLTGTAGHPVSNGVLCPAGIAGHHLATHPLRLRHTFAFDGKKTESVLEPAGLDEIVSKTAGQIREIQASRKGTVAVLDHRPGRALSLLYAGFLSAIPGSAYLLAPGSQDATLATLGKLCTAGNSALGYDIENARVVLSFGAPLFDGWGTPGRMASLFAGRSQTGLKVIQAEGIKSRTALHADTWLPVVPGTEAALALSIGHVLLRDKLAPASLARSVNDLPAYEELVSGFAPEKVSPACGISAEAIVATAHAVAESPSVIISGTDAAGGTFDRMTETAIAALNILAGTLNRPGGIQDSEPTPGQNDTALPATALADQPDGSIRVLIIDGAQSGCTFPPSLLNRKLAPDATVVQLSPYLSDHSALADYFVPSPAAYEAVEEVTAPAGTLSPMFALSMPLLQAPGTSVDPASFIAKLSEALAIPAAETTTEACLRQRARQILLAKKGSVRDATGGSPTPVKDIAGEEDFWRIVSEGGCWYGETVVKSSIVPASLMGPIPATEFLKAATTTAQATGSLKLIPFGWRGTTGSAHVAPVMSKLFQESHLRDLGGRLHVNPATLALAGLADGSHVQVRTSAGTFTGWAVADQAVIPGVVHASVGPSPNNSTPKDKPGQASILEICAVQADGSWRITEATIAKA